MFRHRTAVAIALTLAITGALGATTASAATRTWTVMPRPDDPTKEINSLRDVSCIAADNCFAVGDSITDPGPWRPLVEHWNGTKWSQVILPKGPGDLNIFHGITCTGPSLCIAVGEYEDPLYESHEPLIEAWNGTSWSIQPAPDPFEAADTVLEGVSCPTVTSCFAVGSIYTYSGYGNAIIEHWDGREWSIMEAPKPTPTHHVFLEDVSCPTRTKCFAVGGWHNQSGDYTLVEYWNGRAWKIQPSPKAKGARVGALAGISCPGPKHCFAVGSQRNGDAVEGLAERWGAGKWSIVSTPTPSGETTDPRRSNALNGVACLTATNCFAVGSYAYDVGGADQAGDFERTLVEHWNGNRLTIQPSPSPLELFSPTLAGVSCSSAAQCFAVGTASGTLIERYR